MGNKEISSDRFSKFVKTIQATSFCIILFSLIVLMGEIGFVSYGEYSYGLHMACNDTLSQTSVYIVHLEEPCLTLQRRIGKFFLFLLYLSFIIQWPFWIVCTASSLYLKLKTRCSKENQGTSIIEKMTKFGLFIYMILISGVISFSVFTGLLNNTGGEYCTYKDTHEGGSNIIHGGAPCLLNSTLFFETFLFWGVFLSPVVTITALLYLFRFRMDRVQEND